MYQKNIKESNENKIFAYIFNSQENFVINEIAEKLNMSFPTVKRVFDFFLEKKIITEKDKIGYGVGRKAREYSFNKFFCYSIGVQILKDDIKIVLTNAKGEIRKTEIKQYDKNENIEKILEREVGNFIVVLSENIKNKLIGVGISIPGIVSEEGKFIEFNPFFKTDITVRENLKNSFGCPVFIENQANLSAIAEAFLTFNYKSLHFAALTIGDYISTSSFHKEKNEARFHFKAGRLHHMIVNSNDEIKNYLGAYISNEALLDCFLEKFPKIKEYNEIFNAKYINSQAGQELLDNYIKYMSIGIKNILFLSNPEIIIISGKICKYQNHIKEKLLNEVFKENNIFYRKKESIIFSSFNENSSLIGAALFPIIDLLF